MLEPPEAGAISQRVGMALREFRRVLRRRDIVALCAFIFVADALSGIVIPTFSIYARELGASLVLIGILSSVVGLSSLVTAIPSGVLSDRVGRRPVLLGGMVVWVIAFASFALVDHPYLLFPGRILMGAGIILTIGIAAAFLGDITTGDERGPAFGLYATAMGLGFAVGPLVGGAIANQYDIAASYGFASALAAFGFILGYLTLPRYPMLDSPDAGAEEGSENADTPSARFLEVFLYPPLLIASVAVFLQSAAFLGAVQNFFPLYGQDVAIISAGFIATMFSVRAFVSTGVRLPMGILSARITTSGVMALSLLLMGIALIGISLTTDPVLLTIFLALEGVGFGGFVTAGQAFTAEVSTGKTRGTAMGIYRMAGALGSAGGPILMGWLASQWSLSVVFSSTGIVVLAGALLVGWNVSWRRVFTVRRSVEPA